VISLKDPSVRCEIKFERRGWFSNEAYKFQGESWKELGKKRQVGFSIQGNWNKDATLTNALTKEAKVVWSKVPYPEKWAWMYGMSKFHLQMNYFPKRLWNQVAPTDTRRRTDQRALENGDMKLAAKEKERLENRQRTFRKYYEATGKHHEARYFTKYRNERDGQDYWRYNNRYFEQDRLHQDWAHLPDIFSNCFPEEVE
jgi:hypothetical protein